MPVALWTGDHVDIGIGAQVEGVGIADLEDSRHAVRFVNQMVPIRIAGFEGSAVSHAQNLLTVIADERQLSVHDPDEFVLETVPVTLAGPATGRDYRQVDAEAGQAL